MSAILFATLLIPTISFSQPLSADDELKLLEKCTKGAKEDLIEKKKFTGKLDSFVWGDLFHSEVHGKNGERETFVSGYDDSCFLAQHKNEWLDIEYDLMCQSLPDHAGYVPANVITQIRVKNTDFKSWLKQSGDNDDKCEKLVEKFTRQP
jgi:hypothetical protein